MPSSATKSRREQKIIRVSQYGVYSLLIGIPPEYKTPVAV